MAVVCVKDVRKMYGFPCCVIAAASPPVKFGMPARFVSAMLTTIEPEKTGPITTYAPSSTAFTARAFATCGCDCVSLDVYSILRPRMPPAALISFTASFTPSLKLVPEVAPVPESSTRPKILTGPLCAKSGCTSAAPSTSTEKARAIHIFIVPPLSEKSLRCLRDDVRLDHGTQLGRDLRTAAKPFAKTVARLVEQHAQAIDRTMSALARGPEERRLERHIDDIVDHGAALERREIDAQALLARHAERRAIDEQVRGREQRRQRFHRVRARVKSCRQFLRARQRAIDDVDVGTALLKHVHRRARGATGAQHHGPAARHLPAGRSLIEIGDEAVRVGIAAQQPAVLDPEHIHCADRLRR